MTAFPPLNVIRAQCRPACGLCGARGEELYSALHDRLYGTPGSWNCRACPRADCGLLWLDPMPLEDGTETGFRNIHIWTTIRDADQLFTASLVIRRTGQYACGSRQPIPVRIVGKAFQFVEYVLVALGCQLGEEIAVTAEK